MKKQKNKSKLNALILIAFTIISILSIFSVAQAEEDPFAHKFYNISYECNNSTCVEGHPVLWTIEFKHHGSRPIEYVDFELIDSLNNSAIAEKHLEYYPLRDDRGEIVVSEPGKNASIKFLGTVPKANFRNRSVFYPCFSNTIDDIHVFVRHNDYTYRQCYDDNWTLPVYECDVSNHCKADEFCTDHKTCRSLSCGSCQYLESHACQDYECCEQNHCAYNQLCTNNTCVDLNCGPAQYVDNRTCKTLNCNFDEFVVDSTCQKLECNETQYIFNHTCNPLSCAKGEYIFNHTCRSCAYNQYLDGDMCKPLNCKSNQGFENHECVPLQCSFYQDIRAHECKNNVGVLTKIGIEIVIILAIIVFIVLDIRKAKRMRAG